MGNLGILGILADKTSVAPSAAMIAVSLHFLDGSSWIVVADQSC